jgi:hypothetical protein
MQHILVHNFTVLYSANGILFMENIYWLANLRYAAFTAVPNFLFLLPDHHLHILKNMCIYVYIPDCLENVY